MLSGSLTISAEELYDHLKSRKLPQRHQKFMVRALKEEGYKVTGGRKRYVQRNRGKDAFKPTDFPRLLENTENLSCMMASLVSAVTGTRREETSEILKDNIHFDTYTIRLEITKAGVPQDVCFPRSFAPILKKWIHHTRSSKYLFPQRHDCEKPISVGTLSGGLVKAMKQSGLHKVLYIKENGYKSLQYGFHSFRKFFCSNLVNSKVDIGIAKKLMRHTKIEQTLEAYAKYGQRILSEAMEKVDPYSVRKEETQPNENIFTKQYLDLFNDYRERKISIEDYHKHKAELKELQGFIKN